MVDSLVPDITRTRDFTAEDIADAVHVQRVAFLRDGPPPVRLRRDRIDRLSALTLENADELVEAMRQDFGNRPAGASMFSDIIGSLSDVAHIRRNLAKWMKPRAALGASRALGVRTRVQARPLGVVGVVGPWNFPVLLLTQPATAALAAGNRVMMKASEVTAHTSTLLQNLAGQYFSPEELVVVTGGRETGAAFAAMPFDHLFFTGSPEVARHVQRSAADHLVPLTLELGGKNPVVVGRDADVKKAASRVARSRLVNGGQVCLCPDYVFVPSEGKAEFIATVEQQFHRSFPTILDNPAHCAIVDDKNYERVIDLVADAWAKGANVIEAVPPGESLPSAEQRRIAPTILTDVTNDMDVTTEEVFGPVLTVHTYDRLDEVITYVNARPSPLASYWYGGDSADFRAFCDLTRSGGITRNDFALHAAIDGAPFGGVGQSGSGGYHGKTGFDAFSHYRTVCESRLPVSMTSLLVPPNPPLLDAAVNWAARRQAKRLRRRIEEYRRDSDCPAPPGKGG